MLHEIFNLNALRDDALKKYADEFRYTGLLDDADSILDPIAKNKAKDDLVIANPTIIIKFIKDFGLYDITFSYNSVSGSTELVMTDGCSHIKKVYGCKNLEKPIKYLIN